MPKQITHLSLFPNDKCIVCNIKVDNNVLHCKKCLSKWIESKETKNK